MVKWLRVFQMAQVLPYAVPLTNEVFAWQQTLVSLGVCGEVCAFCYDKRLSGRVIQPAEKVLRRIGAEDVLIFHYTDGEMLSHRTVGLLRRCTGQRVLMLHAPSQVTDFFPAKGGSMSVRDGGQVLTADLLPLFSCALADAEHGVQRLGELGVVCPRLLFPRALDFLAYRQPPDAEVMERYGTYHGRTWLFVGTVAPDKRQECVLEAFACYHALVPQSRLFLVGAYDAADVYYRRLLAYAEALGVEENICIPGRVSFAKLLAFYHLADLFVCMGESEDFYLPIVEAMLCGVPVLAYATRSTWVTSGRACAMLDVPDALAAARLAMAVLGDDGTSGFRAELSKEMASRLRDFCPAQRRREMADLLRRLQGGTLDGYEAAFVRHSYANARVYARRDEIVATRTIEGAAAPLPIFETMAPKPIIAPKPIMAPKPIEVVESSLWQQVRQKGERASHRLSEKAAAAYRMVRRNLFLRPTERSLLFDVSYIAQRDLGTGVQRLVNHIGQELLRQSQAALPVRDVAVLREHPAGWMGPEWDPLASLQVDYRYRDRLMGTASNIALPPVPPRLVGAGSTLFLLDSSWDYYREFSRLLDVLQPRGVRVFALVHDLFPIQYPELATNTLFVERFRGWHDMVLQRADGILCNSRTTADVVARYFEKRDFYRMRPLALYYFHMGADALQVSGEVRGELRAFLSQRRTILMVGTVEPRKGYHIALEAFSDVAAALDVQLLLIGHDGWKNASFQQQRAALSVACHKRLLWLKDASDGELAYAYAHASLLLAASQDEGFGLPLVEAASFGLPILASDIPIFHEVAGDCAAYFPAMDAAGLRKALQDWFSKPQHPESTGIRLYSWEETGREVMEILRGEKAPYRELGGF